MITMETKFEPQGGHSTKNVHGPFEQSFSDPTLNEWLEMLISSKGTGANSDP